MKVSSMRMQPDAEAGRLAGPDGAEAAGKLPGAMLPRDDEVLRRQRKILDAILTGTDLSNTLLNICGALEDALPSWRISLSLFERKRGLMFCAGAPRLPRELVGRIGDIAAENPATPALAAQFGLTTISIPDLSQDPRWADHAVIALSAGFRSCWAKPIVDSEDTVMALISGYSETLGGLDAYCGHYLEALEPFVGLITKVAQREGSFGSASDRFTSLTKTIPGVVYQRLVTPEGDIRYTYISEGARELFGVSPEEIVRNPDALFSRHGPEYKASFRARLIEASRKLETWDVEANIVSRDGTQKFTHAIAKPSLQPDGSVLWTGVILDASRIKQAEQAAAEAEERTRTAIIESLAQGFLMFNSQRKLLIRNSHFDTMFPALAEIFMPGMPYEELLWQELVDDGAKNFGAASLAGEFQMRSSADAPPHAAYERQIGPDRWIQINESRMPDGALTVLYTDVSELKSRERKIHHLAHHDSLTGLPNRVLFRIRLEEVLSDTALSDAQTAIMCLDLDHFKYVNDTLGHPAGDKLLQAVAARLKTCLRENDTAARLGGDEFAVIIRDLPNADYAGRLARRIIQALSVPVEIGDQQVITGTSIGIALSSNGEGDADTLLKCADLALYRAKSDGRGSYRFFESEMDARAQERRRLEMDLRHAIDHAELEVHYQPFVDVYSDRIVGVEALVRWQHPVRGLIAPLDFIGLAEETGLIIPLGEQVLRRACTDASQWRSDIRIAVNLSPAQFRSRNLIPFIEGVLAETNLNAKRLELEITESLLLRDTDTNLKILHSLKSLGIRISMDDFGTGYSSLGNLRSFPFDKIKIDRSFVKDLASNPDSAAIVRAVLGLGRSLGMSTTAEGVETRDQLNYLRAEGCSEAQGYFFSRAVTSAEMEKLIASGVGHLTMEAPDPARHFTADDVEKELVSAAA